MRAITPITDSGISAGQSDHASDHADHAARQGSDHGFAPHISGGQNVIDPAPTLIIYSEGERVKTYPFKIGDTCYRCDSALDPDSKILDVQRNPSGHQVVKGWIHEDCAGTFYGSSRTELTRAYLDTRASLAEATRQLAEEKAKLAEATKIIEKLREAV